MPRTFIRTVLALLPLVALAVSGCSSLNLSENIKWPLSSDKPQIADRVVDVWTDDVLHQTGQVSKRGFGGRLMFYNRQSESPIKVEGSLTVYLFDDHCEDPLREEPLHKFVFPADTLEKHYSKSELGHSYSFWLPVDDVGGVERRLTMIARFQPKVGGRIMGQPSTHVLPGRPADENASPLVQRFQARQYEKKADGQIQQVAYVESVSGVPPAPAPQQAALNTTTINLTPDFTRQIGGTPATPAPALAYPPGIPPTGQVGPSALVPPAALPQAGPGSVASQPVDSRLSRFPVRREAIGRPIASHARTQPLRATWPSALPSTPRWGGSSESSPTATAVPPQGPQGPEQESW
ncbi:MAG: hypothetical protein ACYC6Y_00790 [Thermoguttaceae bacterium]